MNMSLEINKCSKVPIGASKLGKMQNGKSEKPIYQDN